ncbi:MAG: hypothetical protein FJY37_18630, partial [Betaproteobacteria bacterium]|nr:hypothetical protein [Betaproteobacteria bacterium]
MVELMVAVVISLVGTIVIFQVFQVNESIRRETTNGADTQTSGLVALTTIERDLRIAGFGFNDEDLIGCNVTMYDEKRTPKDVPTFRLVPIRITAGAGTVPDTLEITYGTPSITPARVTITDTITGATSNLPITPNQTYGFTPGDVIVVWEIGKPCSIMEVTSTNATQIYHDSGNFFNPITGQTEQSRYNKSTGHGNDYTG